MESALNAQQSIINFYTFNRVFCRQLQLKMNATSKKPQSTLMKIYNGFQERSTSVKIEKVGQGTVDNLHNRLKVELCRKNEIYS